jgi:excisionase family DNA binding protein
MPQANFSELLSVEEAAQRLGGVSRWSIYAWLSQGRIRKTKVGSRVMIDESDLQAFVAGCNPPAAKDQAGNIRTGLADACPAGGANATARSE